MKLVKKLVKKVFEIVRIVYLSYVIYQSMTNYYFDRSQNDPMVDIDQKYKLVHEDEDLFLINNDLVDSNNNHFQYRNNNIEQNFGLDKQNLLSMNN